MNSQQSPDHQRQNQYVRDGFALFAQSIFPAGLLSQAQAAIDDILHGQYAKGTAPKSLIDVGDRNKLQRMTQVHLADQRLFDLLTYSRIGELAAQLTGARRVSLWGSQLYYKPAGSAAGGQVGFHRDIEHMGYFRDGVITAWIPLTDINPSSGPLTYVNGSHRWPQALRFSGAHIQNIAEQRRYLQSECPQPWQETLACMAAGGIAFHHKDTLHGSPENTDQTDRCAIAFGLFTEHLQVDDSQPDHGYGQLLQDSHACPLIYQAPPLSL